MSTGPRPCSAEEAVTRALAIVASRAGQYILGTGDYRPRQVGDEVVDVPWTERNGELGSDCAGYAICYAYKLPRHRPGFAPGQVPPPYRDQLDVDDDINVNSAIEDALTATELFRLVGDDDDVTEGDLLCYPSIRVTGPDGLPHSFVGHVGLVVGWRTETAPKCGFRQWDALRVAQCHGGEHFKPGAVLTDGSVWSHHDSNWPKPAHRTFLLRVVP